MSRACRWLFAPLVLLLGACASLPPLEPRNPSQALTDTSGTRLGRAMAAEIAAHPGKSAVYNLADPRDAFAARGVLALVAEKSIDAQYYIWHGDESGELLLETLWKAAQRGVRVRLLVDDSGTGGLDGTFAAFLTNPNFQVRLYNPFPSRGMKSAYFVTDFSRVNRRMHNKQFTVDNQFSIVGGRNIGNEYFQLGSGLGFTDADVLVAGPIVREISDAFDLYWNSASAYPAERLIGEPDAAAVARLEDGFAKAHADPEAVQYLESLRTTPLMDDLEDRRLELEWTTMKFVCDDPAKTLDHSGREELLLYPELVRAFGNAENHLDIVSPYFVPQEEAVRRIADTARRGVAVRLLTNSLSANDEPIVHAGYKKHREQLVAGGVHLWELKPTAFRPRENKEHTGSSSSSATALHAKVYAVDLTRIFVGSYNFDQRSAHLNTEQGVIIDSPALAGTLASALDQSLRQMAYEVVMAANGRDLVWIDHAEGGDVRYDTDPGTSWWTRAKVNFFSILPIDWLL